MSIEILQQGVCVRHGKDRYRENELLIWGVIPLSTKIATADTNGALYLFEHTHMGKGGPPRHIHFKQDEWFRVVEGEFAFEVGEEKYRLGAGDSLFAPRKVAYVWANVGEEPGTLITAITPAGTFETFIREAARCPTLPSPEEVAKAFAAHEMEVVGPPMQV